MPGLTVVEGLYPEVDYRPEGRTVVTVDGIGSKGRYHWERETYREAALDGLAMSLNDLAMARAKPWVMVDKIDVPEDRPEAINEILETLRDEARRRGIYIVGGETAVHNELDVSVTLVGEKLPGDSPKCFAPGDAIVGLRSNGLHANGFTRVRQLYGDVIEPEFTDPTAIYSDRVYEALGRYEVHGMMHITGGAYGKLKPLSTGADLHFSRRHALGPGLLFQELYRRTDSDEEMYRTFNCGVGFMLSMPENHARKLVAELGEDADVIGEVTYGNGHINIESHFSGRTVKL